MAESKPPVVVGVDESKSAIRAARWAAAVAHRFSAPLSIIYVKPRLSDDLSDEDAAALATAVQHFSEKILQTAQDAASSVVPGLSVTTVAPMGAVDAALIDASRNAHFMVLGCDDVTVGAALLAGSTTLAVASHAACPVIAWRGNHVAPNARPVVVGVDGSQSAPALTAAFEFADRFNAPLHVVHAWSTMRPAAAVTIPFLIDWDALEALQWHGITQVVDPWSRIYPDVKVTFFVEAHKPSAALLRHLTGAQLVVVGNRGRGLLASAVLGSTSLNLLHHSPVPVALCHRGAAD